MRVAFQFPEPGYQYSGASVEGREWSALEDPVKNAACLRNRSDLSIQVHPDDEMAGRIHGKNGKTEMWYILDAEPGASIYSGFRRTISADE